jgi:hypothetical protein
MGVQPMIELVLLACLADKPNDCRDFSLAVENVTPMACMMKAQPEAAKWVQTHPGWTVAKLTCGRVGRYARI